MRWLLFPVVLLLSWGSAAQGAPHCPSKPVRIAFSDRAAGAFLRGTGAEFGRPDPGLVVNEVRAAAVALGCPVQLVRLPLLRLFQGLDQGGVDIGVGLHGGEERLTRWAYPTRSDGRLDKRMAIGSSEVRWVVLRERQPVLQAEWRRGRLSGPLGAAHGTSTQELAGLAGLKTGSVVNLSDVGKLLARRRFDAIALPVLAYAEELSQGAEALATLEPSLGQLLYFAPASRAFAAQAPGYVQSFWQQLCAQARRRPTGRSCEP